MGKLAEKYHKNLQETGHVKQLATSSSSEQVSSTRQRRNAKDTATKWANVLQKITGKSNDTEEGQCLIIF
jgi:ubiquitin-protein ligase E3 B